MLTMLWVVLIIIGLSVEATCLSYVLIGESNEL